MQNQETGGEEREGRGSSVVRFIGEEEKVQAVSVRHYSFFKFLKKKITVINCIP